MGCLALKFRLLLMLLAFVVLFVPTLRLTSFSGSIIPEFTWNPIISRSWGVFVQKDVSPMRWTETSCQAVLGVWKAVLSFRRNILKCWDIVSTWAWQFIGCSLASSEDFSKIPNTAIFVFCMKVFAIFAYWEGSGIFAWSWDIYLFFVFYLNLGWKWIWYLWALVRHFIIARSRVFIVYCTYKRTGNHHFLSTFSKSKAIFWAGMKTVRIMIGVGRRTLRQLSGEVIFWAIAKTSSSSWKSIFELIELITSKWK